MMFNSEEDSTATSSTMLPSSPSDASNQIGSSSSSTKTDSYCHYSRSMTSSTIASTSVSSSSSSSDDEESDDNRCNNNQKSLRQNTNNSSCAGSPRSVAEVMSEDSDQQLQEEGRKHPTFPGTMRLSSTTNNESKHLPSLMNIQPKHRLQYQSSTHHDTTTSRDLSYSQRTNKISPSLDSPDATVTANKSIVASIRNLIYGIITSMIVVRFSYWLPFGLDYEAASRTYYYAKYQYDTKYSEFDNTIWTYGTDYILAIAMIVSAMLIHKQKNQSHQKRHVAACNTNPMIWKSCGLLFMYMFSVIAGGIAHQFYITTESQNTISFRIIWTICVGFVAAASGLMGMIGSEYLRQNQKLQQRSLSSLPSNTSGMIISGSFWIGYAICTTTTVVFGYFSYQSQAADLFLVGITQFPSTFYMIYVLAWGIQTQVTKTPTSSSTSKTVVSSSSSNVIPSWLRVLGCMAFILNAPLLQLYPILVDSFTLPVVNTFLHTWLFMTWNLQGYCMKHLVTSFQSLQDKND